MRNIKFSTECDCCSRLAKFLRNVQREYPSYYAKPVPPFGDCKPTLLIVGLAPGMHVANRTGRPFSGDYAGILLYGTLHKFGFSSHADPLDPDLTLTGCKITNAVKCLPPQNKPLPEEIRRCNPYLKSEISELGPNLSLLALGRIAHQAVLMALDLKSSQYPFSHGAKFALPCGRVLYDSYHCSRYNTQTKRLTEGMFESIFGQIQISLTYSSSERPRQKSAMG